MKCSVGLAVLVALALGSIGVGRSVAQAPSESCLHGSDETPEQRNRRSLALRFTRHINTLQASAFPPNNAYQPAERLTITESLPSGFNLRMSVSGRSYAFSVVDSSDPCRFGYFSDEVGIIFRGEALR